MKTSLLSFIVTGLSLLSLALAAPTKKSDASTQGIRDLVARRMPDHADQFDFKIVPSSSSAKFGDDGLENDEYTVESKDGKIVVSGNTASGLASGLHRYLTDVAHVDIYWFVGSMLSRAASPLPQPETPLNGSSTVPWRYHFNTVTFSYTSAFWNWTDWEDQLDWMALRGVNLPLAWNGIEKVLQDSFKEIGLTDDEISDFFSGPAFQAWNRLGNLQGSWGGSALPQSWIDDQFDLNKKIVARMVELGMTPVLPAFTGFVPQGTRRLFPNASYVNGSDWQDFEAQYTGDTFLEPSDPLFSKLQKMIIQKQKKAYGDVTHIYTLDQYNENNPSNGDPEHLKQVTKGTWQSLKAADPKAIWMLQGWLFFSNQDFWTEERVKAYLSGVENNSDMIVIDLFSESQPQWQRLNSYFGKPWLWCQLHGYGGNMGLYGQIENVTKDPVAALQNSSSLVGYGLTMEGQEGNEVMYTLLLDQAWQKDPIETKNYFRQWIANRYNPGYNSTDATAVGAGAIPDAIFDAWDQLRQTVYNNTDLSLAQSTTKSIFELSPNATGLLDRHGHHPTTITYDNAVLQKAWKDIFKASNEPKDPSVKDLLTEPGFAFDFVDLTRQTLANAFVDAYKDFVAACVNTSGASSACNANSGDDMSKVLDSLENVLAAGHPSFRLSTWTGKASALGSSAAEQSFYAYNARDQVTLWGPTGEIDDYASKQWAGLIGPYYKQRWDIWAGAYVNATTSSAGTGGKGAGAVDEAKLAKEIRAFEEGWVAGRGSGGKMLRAVEVLEPRSAQSVRLRGVIGKVINQLGVLLALKHKGKHH